jgi:AraC-like DNA-binding protein
MRYEDLAPPSGLEPWLADLWSFEVAETVPVGFPHRVVPDGAISIVGGRGGLVLVGPRTEALLVPIAAGERYRGVRFRADAAGNLLGLVPARLRGRVLPLTGEAHPWAPRLGRDLAAATNAAEAGRAVTDALGPLAATARPIDEAVRGALPGLEAPGARVGAVAEAAGLGPRQFHRRFVRAVGLSPKEFMRVRRLRLAMGRLLDAEPAHWARVAAELGYADQAHLVRDAARLAGLPPGGLAAYFGSIAHGRVRP